MLCSIQLTKGVYPQSDRSLAMGFDEYIDASKVFVDLWVHFFLRLSACIEMVIDGKCYFWVSTKFKHA